MSMNCGVCSCQTISDLALLGTFLGLDLNGHGGRKMQMETLLFVSAHLKTCMGISTSIGKPVLKGP